MNLIREIRDSLTAFSWRFRRWKEEPTFNTILQGYSDGDIDYKLMNLGLLPENVVAIRDVGEGRGTDYQTEYTFDLITRRVTKELEVLKIDDPVGVIIGSEDPNGQIVPKLGRVPGFKVKNWGYGFWFIRNPSSLWLADGRIFVRRGLYDDGRYRRGEFRRIEKDVRKMFRNYKLNLAFEYWWNNRGWADRKPDPTTGTTKTEETKIEPPSTLEVMINNESGQPIKETWTQLFY